MAGLLVIAGGAALEVSGGVFGGLALFGAGMGLAEVAFNIEGAAVERAVGRPVLPVLHGCFSLGTVVGALLGMGLTALRFPVGWHLAAIALAVAAAGAWTVRAVPAGTGREEPEAADDHAGGGGWRAQVAVWRDRRLVLIGLIVLAMAFAEGSANDWLPLLMVDGHGTSATAGSLTFMLFAVAMTTGRFTGGPLLVRYGPAAVVRASAVIAAVGVALVVFSSSALLAGAAVVLWGAGRLAGLPGDHLGGGGGRAERLGPGRGRLDGGVRGVPGRTAVAGLPRRPRGAAERDGGGPGAAGRRGADHGRAPHAGARGRPGAAGGSLRRRVTAAGRGDRRGAVRSVVG